MSLILNGTDGLSDVDGTAATPAIRGTDANTGIFFPAADNIAFAEGGAEAMRIDSSGNVGIGTTSPAAVTGFTTSRKVLQVTGSGWGQLRLGGNSGTMLDHDDDAFTVTTLRNLYGASSASAKMQLQSGFITFGTGTSYTEAMRITSGGVLLLNETSTGSSPLMQISGDTSSYNNLTIKDTGTTYSTGNRFAMFTNSSNAVAGQIQHTGVTTTAFATSSDQRLKENIVDAPNALNKIMDIKVRSYDWKEDSSHVEYGFVAQEVNEVYGEPVGVGGEDVKDDPWNIEYGRLTPILLKAIQELNAKVEAQALEIAALKATP